MICKFVEVFRGQNIYSSILSNKIKYWVFYQLISEFQKLVLWILHLQNVISVFDRDEIYWWIINVDQHTQTIECGEDIKGC